MKAIILMVSMLVSTIGSAQINSLDAITSATNRGDSIKAMESNFWYVIQHRRSGRKFKPDSIPDRDIIKIIDAARMAPTSGNQQPWKFLIIKDKNKISLMQNACINRLLGDYEKNKSYKGTKEQYIQEVKKRYEDYFSAPVYIVILTDNNSKYPGYNHWDGPLGAGYLMLAARALGYGTVFITDAISEEITKVVLNIPDNYTRVCITPLGIPYEWPEAHDKKNLEDFIVREKF
jgi:nitroreductase